MQRPLLHPTTLAAVTTLVVVAAGIGYGNRQAQLIAQRSDHQNMMDLQRMDYERGGEGMTYEEHKDLERTRMDEDRYEQRGDDSGHRGDGAFDRPFNGEWPPADFCLSDQDCPFDEQCTVSMGACERACPPGTDICPEVCAGRCVERQGTVSSEPPGTSGEPHCGNGIVERGEECDDGNRDNGDQCNNECQRKEWGGGDHRSRCGDGVCDQGERGECPVDCGPDLDKCQERRARIDHAFEEAAHCERNEDCAIWPDPFAAWGCRPYNHKRKGFLEDTIQDFRHMGCPIPDSFPKCDYRVGCVKNRCMDTTGKDKCELLDCLFGCRNGECLSKCEVMDCPYGCEDGECKHPPKCGEYHLGQSWDAEDGCNTCVCTDQGVRCTLRACEVGDDDHEPDYGDTDAFDDEYPHYSDYPYPSSDGSEGEDAFHQSATDTTGDRCEPYPCGAPRCSEEGYVIDYIVDPCADVGSDSDAFDGSTHSGDDMYDYDVYDGYDSSMYGGDAGDGTMNYDDEYDGTYSDEADYDDYDYRYDATEDPWSDYDHDDSYDYGDSYDDTYDAFGDGHDGEDDYEPEYEEEVRTAEVPENTEDAIPNRFSDVDVTSEVGKAANTLASYGVVGGFPDGEFKGDNLVTRAGAAKFILKSRYGEVPDRQNDGRSPDIKSGEWYEKYMVYALEVDVMNGDHNGLMRPADGVNTAEFLKMITRAFNFPEYIPHTFSDVPEGAWFAAYAGLASHFNLFPERGDTLDPGRELTREEVVIALYRMMEVQ